MAERLNFNAYEGGEEWLTRVSEESDRNFRLFLSLLSSYWKSSVDGPNYTRSIRAMSNALAQVRLSLEDIQSDGAFPTTRAEYLHQVVTSVMFPGPDGAPDLRASDVEFRDFLAQVVSVYFAGSVPESVRRSVELVTGAEVVVREHFVDERTPGAPPGHADEYAMTVDVLMQSPDDLDVLLADRNVRLMLNIVRPAHTLYRVKYVLSDEYRGVQTPYRQEKIRDEVTAGLSAYGYEDFRRFVSGIAGQDPGGTLSPRHVTAEDHSADFV